MRTYLTICLMLLILLGASAQERTLYEKLIAAGDKYFEEEQYNLAIQYYRDALSFNTNAPAVDYKLAGAYRHTFNYTEAEAYYRKVLYTAPNDFPLSLFYYAQMLKLNGKLSEAIERFDRFILFHQGNIGFANQVEQAIVEKAGCEIVQYDSQLPVALKAELMGNDVNTIFNDFAPAFRDMNNMVVTSGRVLSNRALIDDRYGEAFTDNYYLQRVAGKWQDRTRQEFSTVNSTYHDGSGSFTKDGNQYFFTVCEERCRIFETHIENNKWTTPAALNDRVNHPHGESKHPAVSPGGDTLYFASNRPGGFGEFDIWASVNTGENAWGEPVNLGRIVNTKANDIAPGVTSLGAALFFSSEGHPGYGGFDLYVAKGRTSGDTLVYNLNFPFNSAKDDCFVTFNGEDIYWSSNREGGKGGFDIYAGQKMPALNLVSKLALRNRNDSRDVILTSRTAQSDNVRLLASRNEETIDYNDLTYERKAIVNKMVENRLNDTPNRREGFGIPSDEFELLNSISHARFQTILLRQRYLSTLLAEVWTEGATDQPVSIRGQLIDAENGRPLKSARVLLTNEDGDILKITSTNAEGYFRFTGVPGGRQLFVGVEGGSGNAANAVVTNIISMGSNKENSLFVENIYFDFDNFLIRPEATQVLRDLAEYLKSNKGSQVEIYAFADDRGSSAYNFDLTQKRGEAVASYLKSQGVDATSLVIIPKGKQPLLPSTNEIQRQFNRRAEFYVNGVQEAFTPSVKTYILKKEADWTVISKATGITTETLKNLNGSDSDTLKAYQPVRVPIAAKAIAEDLFFAGI